MVPLIELCGLAANPAIACPLPAAFAAAAAENARTLGGLAFMPFGAPETGWRPYAPLIAAEVGTACAPTTPGFAAALAEWQRRAGQTPSGRFTPAVFQQVYQRMQARRPFVKARGAGCPPPPEPAFLAPLAPDEVLGRPIELHRGALVAWRRLRAAAQRAPELQGDPDLLKIYSGFRSPDYQAALCARDGNCDGRRRASCSPHRTGTALDVYLGHRPMDSTAYHDRAAMAATPAFRWLAANGPRFGFVNYAFEPWHWEWTGSAAAAAAAP